MRIEYTDWLNNISKFEKGFSGEEILILFARVFYQVNIQIMKKHKKEKYKVYILHLALTQKGEKLCYEDPSR